MKRSILAVLVAIGLAAAFSFAQYGSGSVGTFTVPSLSVNPGPLTINGVEVVAGPSGGPTEGTNLVLANGVAVNIVDAAGMGDPCTAGGTVALNRFLAEVPSDATSFTFQTAAQAAAQTGLALGDSVTLTADTPTNGICDSVGTVIADIGVVGGTRDTVVTQTYLLLDDQPNVCGGCGGP